MHCGLTHALDCSVTGAVLLLLGPATAVTDYPGSEESALLPEEVCDERGVCSQYH